MSTNKLGAILRELRKEAGLPLRKVAAELDMDVAILSKMERGERKLTKAIVLNLAALYHQEAEPLLIQFLSEKVLYEIGEEPLAEKVIQAAEKELTYILQKSLHKKNLSQAELMKSFAIHLATQKLVSKAWLFGSMARGDNNVNSDVDIVIDVPEQTPFTLFDLADVKENFERLAGRKVDVVMIHGLRPKMRARVEQEMILFYEA